MKYEKNKPSSRLLSWKMACLSCVIMHIHVTAVPLNLYRQASFCGMPHWTYFYAIQKREQPNVPAFAASIPSATYHILDVVGLP